MEESGPMNKLTAAWPYKHVLLKPWADLGGGLRVPQPNDDPENR